MAEEYSVRAVLSAYDKGFSSAMEAAAKQTGALDKGMGGAIKTGGAMALGMKGLDIAIGSVRSHMGAAVDRFDTIQKFPKVMEQLGFSADKAADVMNNKLGPGIEGLPTAMDEIVRSTQSIALITGDLDGAADTAIALNNAFLASGSRGLTQYTQMLTTGKVDMQSWRTLLETMSPALNQVAKEFGYTGATAKNDLYNALKDGTITFDQFNKKLIELSEAEGGFAEQARTQSTGIRTSFQNIGTAVTKGLANSITALEELSKSSGLGSIKDNADKVKAGVNAVFNSINESISKIDLKGVVQAVAPMFKMLGSAAQTAGKVIINVITFIGAHAGTIAKLIPPLVGLVAAFKGIQAARSAVTFVKTFSTAMRGVTTVVQGGTAAIKAQNLAMTIMSAKQKVMTVTTNAVAAAQKVLNLVMKANPFVLVASLIITVVTALGVLQAKRIDVAAAITNFSNTIATKVDAVAQKMPQMIQKMIAALVKNLPKIISCGVKIIVALVSGVIKSIPTIVKAMPKIIAAVVKGLAKIGSSVAKCGAQVITGLWNGIGNKVGWLKSKISGFVGNVKSWLKKFFKIGSPSKLMAKEVGQYLPMGIAKGFDAKSSVVMKSIRGISREIGQQTLAMPTISPMGNLAYEGGMLSNEYSYGGGDVVLNIDGKEFARATSKYTEAEQNRRQMLNNRRTGIR